MTFVSGGTTLGTATVNASGVATLTINPTALGNFSVTATYGGDGNYNSSNVNTSYTVASLNFATLASSVIQRGSLLSLSAAVGPNTDTRSNTPLGSVNFVIPGTPDTLITSVALAQAVNGVYSTTIDTGNPAFNLPVGNYNIVAKYLPGATDAYPAITSNLQTLTVTQQATTTALATTPAAPATVPYGTSVNINATVAPTINGGFPIPFTGSSTINILDGTTIIRNLTVTDAARSPAFDSKNLATALSVGSHNIQAKYLGDGANYSASASSIKTITVNKADTSIAVSGITPVTAIVTSGGALSFQVTISTPSYVEANATRPTGTVTFVSVNTTP
ncbi:MAG: Ig-like domain repeat protein, partial [Planctomycetes bacterium]|nr:Ig-like domain repeat protein [Planctomycetota bacterium]